jgi:transposase InsO family protein
LVAERCRDQVRWAIEEYVWRMLTVQHQKTRPYIPQTNGLVERFNGRAKREVQSIISSGYRDLEKLLKGLNQTYRDEVVLGRLAAEPKLANRRSRPARSTRLAPGSSARCCRQGGLASRQI